MVYCRYNKEVHCVKHFYNGLNYQLSNRNVGASDWKVGHPAHFVKSTKEISKICESIHSPDIYMLKFVIALFFLQRMKS